MHKGMGLQLAPRWVCSAGIKRPWSVTRLSCQGRLYANSNTTRCVHCLNARQGHQQFSQPHDQRKMASWCVQVITKRSTAAGLHMPPAQLLALGADSTDGPLLREAEEGNDAVTAVEDYQAGLRQASAAGGFSLPFSHEPGANAPVTFSPPTTDPGPQPADPHSSVQVTCMSSCSPTMHCACLAQYA